MQTIEELRELVDKDKEQNLVTREPPKTEDTGQVNVSGIIQGQYERNKQEIAEREDFKKATQEITNRAVQAKLEEDAIDILTQEQKNDLAKYVLQIEKEKLDFRKKKEKKIILEEIKAELQNKRIEALKLRYGYMYKESENFIPSKLHNIQKEIVNKWESTSINTKKIIKGIIRILFYGGFAVLIAIVGTKLIKWVIENADKLSMLT